MIKQSFEGSQNPLDVLYAETQASQRAKAEALRGFKPRDSKDAEAPYTRPPSALETATIPASYALDFLADEFDRLAGRTKEEAFGEDIVAAYPGPAVFKRIALIPTVLPPELSGAVQVQTKRNFNPNRSIYLTNAAKPLPEPLKALPEPVKLLPEPLKALPEPEKPKGKREITKIIEDLFTENPLRLDRKTIGKQLNASLGDPEPYNKKGAIDRQIDVTSKLNSLVLSEIGESTDPYKAAENLLKKKGIKDVKILNTGEDPGGFYFPGEIQSDSKSLLPQIQHAEEYQKYGREAIDRPLQYGQPLHKFSNEELEYVLFGPRENANQLNLGDLIRRKASDKETIDKISEYLNSYKKNGEQIPRGENYKFTEENKKLFQSLRGSLAKKQNPDIYLIDLLVNRGHFIEPAGEIDLGLINAAKHGALEIPESIEPYWEQMLREFLEQRAKESKSATVDFGVKPKKSE